MPRDCQAIRDSRSGQIVNLSVGDHLATVLSPDSLIVTPGPNRSLLAGCQRRAGSAAQIHCRRGWPLAGISLEPVCSASLGTAYIFQ
jgi:hypothetical protein